MGDIMEILSLGQKIKKLRKEKNLTLKELAENRITAAQISHIERDKSYPSQDLLEYFSNKLETPVDYFLESKESQAKKIASNIILKSEILFKTQKYGEAKRELAKILNLCTVYDISHECAKANFIYGMIYEVEKEYKKATRTIEQALVLYIKNENPKGIIKSYLELGRLYILGDCYLTATNMLHQAEAMLPQMELIDIELERSIYTNLSYAYMKNNHNKEAIQYAHKAEIIADKIGDMKNRGNGFFIMGNSYLQNQQYDNAQKYFHLAIKCFDKENKCSEKAKSQMLLAKVYINTKDYQSAKEHINMAYLLKKQHKDSQYIEILLMYAEALCLDQNLQEADIHLKEALHLCTKEANKSMEPTVMRKYANLLYKSGNIDEATQNLNKCAELLIKTGNKKELANTYFDIAKTYQGRSKEEELGFYAKGIDLFKEIGIIEN